MIYTSLAFVLFNAGNLIRAVSELHNLRCSSCVWTNHYLVRMSLLRQLRATRLAQRQYVHSHASLLNRKTKRGTTDQTSRDQVLHQDITTFLAQQAVSLDHVKIPEDLIFRFLFAKNSGDIEVPNVRISALTSEGEGLALIPRTTYDQNGGSSHTVVKVPKSTIGDEVTITLRRHYDFYAEAELVSVSRKSRKSSNRNDRLVVCQHFQSCNGCQLQMISYEDQLEFKSEIINRAFRYFNPELDTRKVNDFAMVVPSPLQYAYRTKLTPHAKVPRKLENAQYPLAIGFDSIQKPAHTVDVQNCPIAVPSINRMLPALKEAFHKNVKVKLDKKRNDKVDANFILRDSLRINGETGGHENVCLTHRNNVITEKIGDFIFQFEANEFFQNNRSILPTFLDFIRYQLLQVSGGYKHIVDSYCGSGFLGISLSDTLPEEGKVFGIEIAKKSIDYAKHNAEINGLNKLKKIKFVHGSSDLIFTDPDFLSSGVKGDDSILIMNPSRKGSTEVFMSQILELKPKAVVYISCNVFTQARDLATLQRLQRRSDVKYRVKTVTGFDFYPQTKHVETVAVLELDN